MSTIQRVLYELVGVDHASGAFDRAGMSAGRMESKISKLGKGIAIAGAAIAGGAAIIGVESVKAATEFQTSMTKISTQAGGTRKDVKLLSGEVLKLGTTTQQGPQELADSLYHLKSVGLDNVKAMQALRAASDLAAVGGASLEDTTNAIAGAWRSGVKGAQSFGQAAATVNAIIGAGNMRMTDFIDAIGTGILPSARTFGVSLKSVGAALALMTDEGIPANSAATRLRMSLSLLGAPSAVAQKQLSSIGLTGLKLANAMRGPQGIIGAIGLLKSHLDASGLSLSEQAQLLSHAFGGGRSSSAILTLINNYDVLRRKQDQINKSMGNFGPAVTEQRKTAAAQFALLKSNIDVIGIRIGLALLPPVTKFAAFLAKTVVPGAEAAAGKVGKVFNSVIPVKSIEKDWNDVLRFFGLNKPKPVAAPRIEKVKGGGSIDTFYGSMKAPLELPTPKLDTFYGGLAPDPKKLTSAFSKINWGQVVGSAISGAVKGADKIGAGVATLLSKINWTQLGKEAVIDFVPFVIGFVNNLATAVIDEAIHHPLDLGLFIISLIPIGRFVGIAAKIFGEIPLLGPIIKLFAKPLEAAGGFVETALGKLLGKVFGPVLDRITPFFRGAADWLRGKGESVILGLWYGAEDSWGKVAGWLGKLGEKTLAPFAKAASWLTSKGSDIITGLVPGMWRGYIKYIEFLDKLGSFTIKELAGAGKWLVGRGSDIITGLWRGLTDRWPAVTGFVEKIGGRVLAPLRKAGSWLLETGGNIILGLLRGIRAKMAGIGSWVKGNIIDPVINAVKHFFGIKSPSTVFHGIGLNLVAGLIRGLATTDGESIAKTIFGSLPKALGSIVGKGLVEIGSLPGKALKALGGLGGDLLGFLGLGGGGTSTGSNVALGKAMAAAMGWTGGQFDALNKLWTKESGWNSRAKNPSSGAYGIPQALPASKMASAGADWLTNAATQIRWGLGYIAQRYGSPLAAWAHETAFNWYAKGTGGKGAMPGWAWVGEKGPELVRFKGGEDVLDHGTSKAVTRGYATGTDLAKLGRELLRRHHTGVLDTEITNTRHRYQQDSLLASAPGGRHKAHYAAMAKAENHRLKNLQHTLAAEKAYRARLNARISTLTDTVKAARKHGLPGEAAQLEARIKRAQKIVHNIDLWVAGKPKPKAAAKPAAAAAAAAPTGNMDIADWAAYLDAVNGGAPGLAAFKTGSWFVPATAPAVVHKGEMIFPADVAQAIRDGASGGGNGGGQFTGELRLDSGELLGVVDGRIEKSDRKFNRRVAAGTGRR